MRSVFTAVAKSFVLGFAMLIFMTLSRGVARAESVTINVITFGAFNSSIFSEPPVLFGLTFNGTSFPNPIATVDTSTSSLSFLASTINLGSLTLTGDPATYTGSTFGLQLTFTFPTPSSDSLLITGSSLPSFTASLTGIVQSSSEGSLTVDFSNAPSVFTIFVNGNPISTFTISVNDIIIQPGETANIVGTVQTSEIPEPTTLLMLGTGLAGVGVAVRKRRKLKQRDL